MSGRSGAGVAVPMDGLHAGDPGSRSSGQPRRSTPAAARADTLSRERLNAWLERAAAGRLGLIVAEAGFGKTTLLADWAMRTPAPHELVPARARRSRLAHLHPPPRRGRPRAGPGVRPGDVSAAPRPGPGRSDGGGLTASIAREMAEFGARAHRRADAASSTTTTSSTDRAETGPDRPGAARSHGPRVLDRDLDAIHAPAARSGGSGRAAA